MLSLSLSLSLSLTHITMYYSVSSPKFPSISSYMPAASEKGSNANKGNHIATLQYIKNFTSLGLICKLILSILFGPDRVRLWYFLQTIFFPLLLFLSSSYCSFFYFPLLYGITFFLFANSCKPPSPKRR